MSTLAKAAVLAGWSMFWTLVWLAWSASTFGAATRAGGSPALALVIVSGCTGSIWFGGLLIAAVILTIFRRT